MNSFTSSQTSAFTFYTPAVVRNLPDGILLYLLLDDDDVPEEIKRNVAKGRWHAGREFTIKPFKRIDVSKLKIEAFRPIFDKPFCQGPQTKAHLVLYMRMMKEYTDLKLFRKYFPGVMPDDRNDLKFYPAPYDKISLFRFAGASYAREFSRKTTELSLREYIESVESILPEEKEDCIQYIEDVTRRKSKQAYAEYINLKKMIGEN